MGAPSLNLEVCTPVVPFPDAGLVGVHPAAALAPRHGQGVPREEAGELCALRATALAELFVVVRDEGALADETGAFVDGLSGQDGWWSRWSGGWWGDSGDRNDGGGGGGGYGRGNRL